MLTSSCYTSTAREVSISLLDARAGIPPTAVGMLIRHGGEHGMEALRQVLYEWEQGSAELMDSHLWMTAGSDPSAGFLDPIHETTHLHDIIYEKEGR